MVIQGKWKRHATLTVAPPAKTTPVWATVLSCWQLSSQAPRRLINETEDASLDLAMAWCHMPPRPGREICGVADRGMAYWRLQSRGSGGIFVVISWHWLLGLSV